MPPPAVAIADGGSGLASALKHEWPNTPMQRCLVHVQRNIRRHLTRRPRTDAGQELAKLARALTRITTSEEAVTWLAALHTFGQTHHHLLSAKTYPNGPLGPWWWTHERLRKAYRLLELLAKRGHLFTYLDPGLPPGCPPTTNRIEGAINAQLRALALHHRGMPANHLRHAVDLWIYLHAEGQHPVHTLIPTATANTASPHPHELDDAQGPTPYDTAFSWEDGNGIQHGWAGRSHRP